MKSFIAALCLGTVMVGAGILHLASLERSAATLEDASERVGTALAANDYVAAQSVVSELESDVERFERIFDIFGNHAEMDAIATETARLKSHVACGQKYDALSSVEALRLMIDHLPRNSRLRAENVF